MQGLKVLFVVFDELRCGDLDGALSCPVLVMIIILFYPCFDVLLFYTREKNIFFMITSKPCVCSTIFLNDIIIKYFQVLLGKIIQVLSITINYFIVLIPK
jgi:hypothetical protein